VLSLNFRVTASTGLSITLHGPPYPPSASPSVAQSLNLTLLCAQDAGSDPEITAYNDGVMSVEWKTPAGCPVKRNDDGSSGDGEKEVEVGRTGSGIGWFFLLYVSSPLRVPKLMCGRLLISFVGYFALGAYYNYNNFGATGWDLVPYVLFPISLASPPSHARDRHRDFWRDVPYLFRDFTEHLCSTLRPGRQGGSRRGYMAV
jgi:hypothetical protein